jgi:plasmid stabilization system protein ParE
MKYGAVIQPRAARDIRWAAFWILGRSGSRATALRWVRNLRSKIATLEAKPQSCPIDPDSKVYGEEVRVLLYGKRPGVYRVLFAIRGDTVHVLTVRHAAQQSLAEEMDEDN